MNGNDQSNHFGSCPPVSMAYWPPPNSRNDVNAIQPQPNTGPGMDQYPMQQSFPQNGNRNENRRASKHEQTLFDMESFPNVQQNQQHYLNPNQRPSRAFHNPTNPN